MYFVSKRQRRFVDVEANLGKNPLPGDQKPSGKFHTNLTHLPHTFAPGGSVFQTHQPQVPPKKNQRFIPNNSSASFLANYLTLIRAPLP
jgi:hypothetical protein